MPSDMMKEIHGRRKKLEGLATITFIVLVIFGVLGYLIFLRGIFQDSLLADIVHHVAGEMWHTTLLGSFYTAFFGGLFFVFLPLEATYIAALTKNHAVAVYAVYMAGIMLSAAVNYLVGYKLSKLSRRLISTKNFYKTKCYVNKYGKAAVFVSNAVPFMPCQPITFVLGIFRYNWQKTLILTITAQMLKHSAMLAFYRLFV
jgi:membrane protein YqaA with SNARE-associated domain